MKAIDNTLRKSFAAGMPKMQSLSAAHWYEFFEALEIHARAHRVYILPIDEVQDTTSPTGFTIGDQQLNPTIDFPIGFSTEISTFQGLLYDALMQKDILPKDLQDVLRRSNKLGYNGIFSIHKRYHPDLTNIPPNYTAYIPRQSASQEYNEFAQQYRFYQKMSAYMENNCKDFYDILEQNQFIHNLSNSKRIMQQVKIERIQQQHTNAFTEVQFINTIYAIQHEVNRAHPLLATRKYSKKPAHLLSLEELPIQSIGDFLVDTLEDPDHNSSQDYITEHSLFQTAVRNLNSNLNHFQNRPCAICNDTGHSFSECHKL